MLRPSAVSLFDLPEDVAVREDVFPDGRSCVMVERDPRVHDLTLISSDRPIRRSGALRTLW
jgi:hypothetical protein